MDTSRARFVLLLALGLCGCGGTNASHATTTAQRSASSEQASVDGERLDPRMHAALDRLHPPGSLPLLARVEAGPTDTDALADAAEAYATTDACGMTILWGQTYRLLAPEGERGVALARAIRHVYETRITVTVDGSTRNIRTRLAPGATPALAMGDGVLLVPFAHRYETTIGATSPDPSSFEGVATSIARYPHLASLGAAITSSETELAAYLRAFDDELLTTYAHWVVGPAFDAEWDAYREQHADALSRLAAHLSAHPFVPTRGVRPDDLVNVLARERP